MRVSCLFVICLLFTGLSLGQDTRAIDSLKTLIATTDQDTTVCAAYLSWGEQLYGADPDTAMIIWRKAEELASGALKMLGPSDQKHETFSLYQADAMMNMAYLHKIKGEINTSLTMYEKALESYQAFNSKMRIAYALNNIGIILQQQGDIITALEYYHQCLILQAEIGDKSGEATSLNNMAALYDEQGDRPKALEFNEKSLTIREEIGDKHNVANSLNNLGGMFFRTEEFAKALGYFQRCLTITRELGDKSGTAKSLQRVGGAYCRLDSTETGFKLLKEGLALSVELEDIQWVGYTSDVISMYYMAIDELDSAERYAEISMIQAKELNFPVSLDRAAKRNYEVFRAQEHYEQALEMYELHITMRDSIKNEQTQKATIRQQTKYEFEKEQLIKEQEEKERARVEAEVTDRRDNLQYSIILIALLTLFGGVLALGYINVSERMAEGIIFFSFLILFEFLLVLADPYIEDWSGGAPGIKLLFNAGIAALIFPAHAFFETMLKKRLTQ